MACASDFFEDAATCAFALGSQNMDSLANVLVVQLSSKPPRYESLRGCESQVLEQNWPVVFLRPVRPYLWVTVLRRDDISALLQRATHFGCQSQRSTTMSVLSLLLLSMPMATLSAAPCSGK